MNKSVFVVIMGAGRCGTTYVMNHLNERESTNIFGEDMGATLSLINTLYRTNQIIEYSQTHPKLRFKEKKALQEDIQKQVQGFQHYIGNEMYHEPGFFLKMRNFITDELGNYFNSPITGFKEIRWDLFDELDFLSVLTQHFTAVKFIFLTRDQEKILQSSSELWKNESLDKLKQRISAKTIKIENFLKKQNQNDVLIGDVTTDSTFINRIDDFIYGISPVQ